MESLRLASGRAHTFEASDPLGLKAALLQRLKEKPTRLPLSSEKERNASVMRSEAMAVSGLELTSRDYLQMICTYGQASAWALAVSMLGAMQEKFLLPQLNHFNRAMWACQKASKWQAVLETFRSMEDSSIQGDVLSKTAVLQAAAEQSLWEIAISMWTTMDVKDTVALSCVMTACGRGKKWWLTLGLMDSMHSWQLEKDEAGSDLHRL